MGVSSNFRRKTPYGAYSPDGSGYEPGYGGYKKQSPIVKWYDVKMSYEEKARFNLLTYQELLEWQQQMMEEAMKASSENQGDNSAQTFWTNDTHERVNVSNNEYEEFLSQNNIDVSNRNSLDFDSLSASVNSGSVTDSIISEPESEDDILARVNAANGVGCDRVLTDEEIAALFAAAAANN